MAFLETKLLIILFRGHGIMERIYITPWFYYDIYKTKNRIIHCPSKNLKKIQRLILQKYFKAFYEFDSVYEAASKHCNKKWLLKLDIKDFYNSISKDQIMQVLERYIEENDVQNVYTMCTLNDKLPTGAATSPYIANLLLKDFDNDIKNECKDFGANYSRYMDDLFFSTDKEQYNLSLIELKVLEKLKELGFKINVDKIKYISSNKRQQVLGLGVNNKKPVLTKDDKRKYRAYFYNLIAPVKFNKIYNYESHEVEFIGHLAYIKSVDIDYYNKIRKYILNLINRLELREKPCLKRVLKRFNQI